MFLLIQTTIQLIDYTIKYWLYKGLQASYALLVGFKPTVSLSTCPGHGSHKTTGILTPGATMTRTTRRLFKTRYAFKSLLYFDRS